MHGLWQLLNGNLRLAIEVPLFCFLFHVVFLYGSGDKNLCNLEPRP